MVYAFHYRPGPVTHWFLTPETPLHKEEDLEPGLDLTCPAVMIWKLPRGHVTLPSDCAGVPSRGVFGLACPVGWASISGGTFGGTGLLLLFLNM